MYVYVLLGMHLCIFCFFTFSIFSIFTVEKQQEQNFVRRPLIYDQ